MKVQPMMATWLALAGFLIYSAEGIAAQRGHRQPGESSSTPASANVFRLDGGDVTYAVGVTKQGSVQTVYWGARLAPNDPLPAPHPVGRPFEMDDSPQEFAGGAVGLWLSPR